MEMFPLTDFLFSTLSVSFLLHFKSSLATWGRAFFCVCVFIFILFFLTASLGYYFYNQEQLLKSPLAPLNVSDIFNLRAFFELLKKNMTWLLHYKAGTKFKYFKFLQLGGSHHSNMTTVPDKNRFYPFYIFQTLRFLVVIRISCCHSGTLHLYFSWVLKPLFFALIYLPLHFRQHFLVSGPHR